MDDTIINKLYDDIFEIYELYKTGNSFVLSHDESLKAIMQESSTLSNSNTPDQNLPFFTIKVTTAKMAKILTSYGMFYLMTKTKSHMLGFDFEFNQGKIALWQVSFYADDICYIFVIDPYIFEKDCSQYKSLVIETIFTSPLKKIVHGADSLDMPYIFNELFEKNHVLIHKFIKRVFDTRFLCEYIKLINNDGNKKCSIYDALLYFKVISQTEYDDLNNLTISMGPVQDVNWNLYNMSSFHLKYTMYDVLFLKNFIKNIYKSGIDKNELDIVSQINRFTCYEKYEISGILQESKQIVDVINNYFVIISNSQLKLIDIYDIVIKSMSSNNNFSHFLKTMEINNFKKLITMIFKRIVYVLISESHKIYENKKTIYATKISYINIFDKLLKFKFVELSTKIMEFTNEAKKIIKNKI